MQRSVEIAAHHAMYMPPLTCIVSPVMYPAREDARNATVAAMSSA